MSHLSNGAWDLLSVVALVIEWVRTPSPPSPPRPRPVIRVLWNGVDSKRSSYAEATDGNDDEGWCSPRSPSAKRQLTTSSGDGLPMPRKGCSEEGATK
jgi:hypothetical protein